MRDIKQLEFYFRSGEFPQLTPLRPVSSRFTGKEPFTEWTTKRYEESTICNAFKRGFNVGFVLENCHLVIDCDPRNYPQGVDSLANLENFLGVKLSDVAPAVKTGSGGYHFYLTKPADVNITETLEQFEGIEFKTFGRQVVCAGCETRFGEYRFINNIEDFYPVPEKLLNMLKTTKPSASSDNSEKISNETLRLLLEQLPVDKFDSNDRWQPLMMACHHATDGDGIEEFIAWSTKDPKYSHSENQIRHRWNSVKDSKDTNITIATLYKLVQSYGGTVNVLCDEFTEFADGETNTDNLGLDDPSDVDISDYPDYESKKKELVDPQEIFDMVDCLCPSSTKDEFVKATRAVLTLDGWDKAKQLDIIQKKSGLQKRDFNKYVAELEKQSQPQQSDDQCRDFALFVLDKKFNGSKNVIFSQAEQIWWFNGLFWQIISDELLGNFVDSMVDEYKEEHELEYNRITLIRNAIAYIKMLVAQKDDVLNLCGLPKPIINCRNGELHITELPDGRIEYQFKPTHDPENHQIYVTDIIYNPQAECPIYDSMLRDVFAKYSDDERSKLIQMWWEMVGYILYARKKPAYWFLIKGNGNDGKSTMISIIASMLGESATIYDHIERFKQGAGSDSHASTSLVGKLLLVDEDVNRRAKLPDGVLKKLAEEGKMTANPKGKPTFTFTRICTVVLICNNVPRTDDVSRGFERRVVVFPFNRSFDESEVKINIAEDVLKSELPGIFNKALDGLKRFRARGGKFDVPQCSIDAKRVWMSSANNITGFVNDCITKTNNDKDMVKFSDIYKAYCDWCSNMNIKASSKSEVSDTLDTMNFIFKQQGHKPRIYYRIQLTLPDFTDFESGFEVDDDEKLFANS